MNNVTKLSDFKKKKKERSYEDALVDNGADPRVLELQQAYEYLETARVACDCWSLESVLLALQQVLVNQLSDLNETRKVFPALFMMNMGRKVVKELGLTSKPEAHVLMHFLKEGYIDSIKLIRTEANDPIVVTMVEGRILICSSCMFWDGSSLVDGLPTFEDSFKPENALIECKNLLSYMIEGCPELAVKIIDSPFWTVS
jgi:hypothetical protein